MAKVMYVINYSSSVQFSVISHVTCLCCNVCGMSSVLFSVISPCGMSLLSCLWYDFCTHQCDQSMWYISVVMFVV